ncbi:MULTISPECIES: TetR/AcrR family transcriptional regulator [unclassified Oceanispirochaeta]|uniref:TetR/AcrR family transcriptional regulator n=1 Tax=unclassified Oceanispirochaeta TaxID=2635722 RepID=UPI0018F302AD|nr:MULTISPECIES: TetR/AcrR family transcriptional regulator [unclassified Oceanispirochaeta]
MMPMKYHNDSYDRISQEKKDRIISVALDEFATKGFSNANTNVIAEKAGISVGSLFKYFENKENFFLTVINYGVSQLETVLGSVVASDESLETKLETILRTILSHTRSNENIVKLYNEMTSEGNSELIKRLSSDMETVSAEAYTHVISQAKIAGKIADDIDVRVFAFALDNLFMSLQFSYASEYYKERMKIYVGEDVFDNDELIIQEMMKFISRAFSVKS